MLLFIARLCLVLFTKDTLQKAHKKIKRNVRKITKQNKIKTKSQEQLQEQKKKKFRNIEQPGTIIQNTKHNNNKHVRKIEK